MAFISNPPRRWRARAVRIGEPSDLLVTRAEALCDLAEVLALGGRREDAIAALDDGSELYERTGNLTALARARTRARLTSQAEATIFAR
jgi:hypothetical protein